MLRHLGCHENIITLYDVVTMPYVRIDYWFDETGSRRVH